MFFIIALGVLLAVPIAIVMGPRIRRSRSARPHRMMPRWPEDWPPRAEYLMRSLPPRPPQRWSWREGLSGMYWWSQRLHWRAEGGYLATVSGRRMIGSGAVRLGRLVPTNWTERRFPVEVWVPRSLMYRHLGIAGPTGAGKTATFGVSVPYYAAFSGQSVFLNDVKNPPEYFAWFVDHFRRHGRHAINFNPWTPHEAECRAALLDLVPETVTAVVAWRFCVGELLIDYGAYARAMHLDLMRLADTAAVDDAAFVRAFEQAEYEMQARGTVLREMRQGTRLASAMVHHPGRLDLAVRLASASRTADVEHQVATSLGILAMVPTDH